MKNFITLSILALFACVSFTSAATPFQNQVKCGKRFPMISFAIDTFCKHSVDYAKGGFVVPSPYAKSGFGTTGIRNNRFIVKIESRCQPQWLPYKWCVSQLNDMCANTKNKWGYHTQRFGKGSCQKFIIGPRSSPEDTTLSKGMVD